jgi:hypothetical protein
MAPSARGVMEWAVPSHGASMAAPLRRCPPREGSCASPVAFVLSSTAASRGRVVGHYSALHALSTGVCFMDRRTGAASRLDGQYAGLGAPPGIAHPSTRAGRAKGTLSRLATEAASRSVRALGLGERPVQPRLPQMPRSKPPCSHASVASSANVTTASDSPPACGTRRTPSSQPPQTHWNILRICEGVSLGAACPVHASAFSEHLAAHGDMPWVGFAANGGWLWQRAARRWSALSSLRMRRELFELSHGPRPFESFDARSASRIAYPKVRGRRRVAHAVCSCVASGFRAVSVLSSTG